ncbi:MAG: GntR family transcriptional regulator [Planctomycetes bacterium]|nr:GntR family transcriptional regulator [Planctomycetota bacterium]
MLFRPEQPARPGRPQSYDAEYRKVADALRERIESGEFMPGAVLPSFRALAKTYDVSEITVRGAMDVLKSENRVQVNARRRHIVTNPSYAGSVTENLILEVVGNYLHKPLRNAYFRQIQLGIEKAAGETRASLLIANSPLYRSGLPPDGLDLPLRGVLLIGHFEKDVLPRYEKLNVPVVLVDQPNPGYGIHTVSVANRAAGADAVARLAALGHRQIAFVRSVLLAIKKVDPDSRERQHGYEEGLAAAGLPKRSALLINSVSSEQTAQAVTKLLKQRPRVTAVLTVDKHRAVIVEEAARALGLKVPRDLSIVCYQEREAVPGHCSGPVIPFEDFGAAAFGLFDGPRSPARRVLVPTVWQDGKTIGPAP